MTGVLPRFKHGPITFEVIEAVKGGQFIEARSTGDGKKVGVAGLDSTTCLGVALIDARPTQANTGTTADGFPYLDISGLPKETTVDDSQWINVKFGGAVAFGKAIKCGALGTAVAWVSGTDAADLIVGYCAEPGGAANGATALARVSR